MDNKILTIIKNTKLNILFGAGASKFSVPKPFPLMGDLLKYIKGDAEYNKYKQKFCKCCFDQAVNNVLIKSFESDHPDIEDGISKLEGLLPYAISKEFEDNLSEFIIWLKKKIMNCLSECDTDESANRLGKFYYSLVKMNDEKISPLKRINVFTTNYDMLSEIALEKNDIHYYAGFNGICTRKFNLAMYNYQYSENLGINRDSHSYISQINLYKLHGSLSWKIIGNKLVEVQDYKNNSNPIIIYPSSAKYFSTNLITYYSALFREFSNEINKDNSCLIVIGSGLNDDHINKIILDALALPSFTLIVFSWCSNDEEKIKIKKQLIEKFGERENAIFNVSSDNTIENLSLKLFQEDEDK